MCYRVKSVAICGFGKASEVPLSITPRVNRLSLESSLCQATMMTSLIALYGYWAVFFGTLLEGESILLAAGFACHQGLLDWRLALLLAVAVGVAG